jgi:hypothetical protein
MARAQPRPRLSAPRFLSALMRMSALRYACRAQQTATPLENQRIATHARSLHHATMRTSRIDSAQSCASLPSL